MEAANGQELKEKLDADKKTITQSSSVTDKEWYERLQFKCFLEVAAERNFISFPLKLWHTSDENPDFKISYPDCAIGVEASRITNEPLHRLKALRRAGETCEVLSPSVCLRACEPITNDGLISQTTPGAYPGNRWNVASAEDQFWLKQALDIIDRKTRIRRRNDYHDYGMNWLLLWDELSMEKGQFPIQADLLQARLPSYWAEERVFDKIILECDELRDFAILSSAGIVHWDRQC
jgi:hypothetical protein